MQFDRVGFTPPETPAWVQSLRDVLGALEPVLELVFWCGLALILGGLVFLIGREVLKLRAPRARPRPQVVVETEWRPDETTARNLLAGADALAAQGRYAEAAHLLLLRSVEDIELKKPRAVRVSLTTREIAALSGLPEAARPTFGLIGTVVERSLFGGRPVDAADFAECRRAYEAFALPEGWRA
ncbi:DUF4129 domain-containing protein [Brevundimonas sp. VNH65]|uniref:DUF4129 domain-containing protein n=1 Tax=Brevundimonas sp. VNH65 TaxID=3400917 RepID=UPI003C072ECF